MAAPLSALQKVNGSVWTPSMSSMFAKVTSVENLRVDHNFRLPEHYSEMEPSEQLVEFFPVIRKGPNYLKYCTGWLSDNEKPQSISHCIQKYTNERDWFCTKINLALASDSPSLEKYGLYIKHLKYCIGISKINFYGTVFRGKEYSILLLCIY